MVASDGPIIDFYFGVGSRYSYLAATQLPGIERQYGCTFHWKPIASGRLMEKRGGNPFRGTPVSGQYDWSYREYDAKCLADYYGVPFREPRPLPAPHLLPLACLAAERQDRLIDYARRLFRAIFIEAREIDETALKELAVDLGLDEPAFSDALASADIRDRHEGLIIEAHNRGAFGVPTFFLGDRMFWGNDRLVLLKAALEGSI